jgi:hypothetical protein
MGDLRSAALPRHPAFAPIAARGRTLFPTGDSALSGSDAFVTCGNLGEATAATPVVRNPVVSTSDKRVRQ